MNDNILKPLDQYYFERDVFCDIFHRVFSDAQIFDIEVACQGNTHRDEFSLFHNSDEFYILHRDSGIMINYYKHLGRTNTCNKQGLTLDDLKYFLEKLKEELLIYGDIIK